MNRKNSATALYSSGFRLGAVITQKLAPPMIEFFGALPTPGQYGSMAAPHSTLASFKMRARSPEEPWIIAHSPDGNSASPALSRPPYLNVPSFCMSIKAWTCFTWAGLLILSSASVPAMPLALVASGTSWMALNCSNWVHVGQAVVNAHGAALAALILRAASMSSGQVCGGLAGSSPAFLKASLL